MSESERQNPAPSISITRPGRLPDYNPDAEFASAAPTTGGDTFDGTADDVVMPDEVRAAAEARIAAAVAKYGDAPVDS